MGFRTYWKCKPSNSFHTSPCFQLIITSSDLLNPLLLRENLVFTEKLFCIPLIDNGELNYIYWYLTYGAYLPGR